MCVFGELSHIRVFATSWTVACQAPLSMGFPREEYWSGVPLPSPEAAWEAGLHVMHHSAKEKHCELHLLRDYYVPTTVGYGLIFSSLELQTLKILTPYMSKRLPIRYISDWSSRLFPPQIQSFPL